MSYVRAFAQQAPCPKGCKSTKPYIIKNVIGTLVAVYDGRDDRDPNDYTMTCTCQVCNTTFDIMINVLHNKFTLLKVD